MIFTGEILRIWGCARSTRTDSRYSVYRGHQQNVCTFVRASLFLVRSTFPSRWYAPLFLSFLLLVFLHAAPSSPTFSLTPFLRPSFSSYPFLFLLSRFLFGATTHTHTLISTPPLRTTISYLFLFFFSLSLEWRTTEEDQKKYEYIFLTLLELCIPRSAHPRYARVHWRQSCGSSIVRRINKTRRCSNALRHTWGHTHTRVHTNFIRLCRQYSDNAINTDAHKHTLTHTWMLAVPLYSSVYPFFSLFRRCQAAC